MLPPAPRPPGSDGGIDRGRADRYPRGIPQVTHRRPIEEPEMPQPFSGRAFLFCACLFGAFLTSGARADVRQIALPTNDLVYDSHSGKLYGSVPSSAGAHKCAF